MGTNQSLKPDVLIVGGGTAGVAAAVAAARSGAETLLVERYGSLGGTLTSVSLGSLCGYFTIRDDDVFPVVGGIANEIVERLQRLDGVAPPLRWLRTASLPYDLYTMRLVMDDIVSAEDIQVLLHAYASDFTTGADGQCDAVRLVHKGGETWVHPRIVVDCSGDADVVAASGLAFDMSLSEMQSATTMFRLGGVDTDLMSQVDRAQLHRLLGSARDSGLDLPRTAGGMYTVRPGVVHVNITKIPSPFDPLSPSALTRAEMLGRRQVMDYVNAFKTYVPGFANAFVLDTGHTLGIRESRRIRGKATVTEDYVKSAGRCEDAIACSAWPVEDHKPGGEADWGWLEPGEFYQIPFGCMVPERSTNVLVAGRSISATHRAQASLRVAAQCFAMGEAAGMAAAQACATTEREVSVTNIDVPALQRRLVDSGAFLGPVITSEVGNHS